MKVGQKAQTTNEYNRLFQGKHIKGIVVEISDSDDKIVCLQSDCCGEKHWINKHWLKDKLCALCGSTKQQNTSEVAMVKSKADLQWQRIHNKESKVKLYKGLMNIPGDLMTIGEETLLFVLSMDPDIKKVRDNTQMAM